MTGIKSHPSICTFQLFCVYAGETNRWGTDVCSWTPINSREGITFHFIFFAACYHFMVVLNLGTYLAPQKCYKCSWWVWSWVIRSLATSKLNKALFPLPCFLYCLPLPPGTNKWILLTSAPSDMTVTCDENYFRLSLPIFFQKIIPIFINSFLIISQ